MQKRRILWAAILAVVLLAGALLLARRGANHASASRSAAQPTAVATGPKSSLPAATSVDKVGSATAAMPVARLAPPSPPLRARLSQAMRERYQKLDAMPLSKPVRVLVGLDGQARDSAARIAALKQLTRRLGEADATALRMFLDFKARDQDPSDKLQTLQFEALKNDVLCVLLEQETFPVGLGVQLVAMWRDGDHDDIWRIYCLQYMGEYYKRRWPASDTAQAEEAKAALQPVPSADGMPDERTQIEAAYWEAVDQRAREMAGTALIALAGLARTYDRFDPARVRAAAVAAAADDSCGEPSRITAFGLCAQLGCKEVLPAARAQAQGAVTEPLRMAAIAVLGVLGESEDKELLILLAKAKDPRLHSAAEAALARLRAPPAQSRGRRLLDLARAADLAETKEQ